MNIVYLSPHFPPNYAHFCRALKEAGANVLAIGDEDYNNLSPLLKASLNDYYRVNNMHNYDEVLRACGYFTFRYGKIDRFDSQNEHWLETEGKIRDDFNIYGMKSDYVNLIKRKSRMKKVFQDAGIKVARGKVVNTLTEAENLIKDTGYPVVAKPDIGVGAADTFKIRNEEELKQFFLQKPEVDYIMEEFIDGIIYTYDGLADRESNPVFGTSHTYSKGVMELAHTGDHVYYYNLRDIPKELEDLGKRTLKAFDFKERFFHIEFFKTKNNEYIALELNARPPGGFTMDMFNYSSDIDTYRAWADLLLYNKTDIGFERKYHACFLSIKDNKNYVHSRDEIMQNYGDMVVHDSPMPGAFRGVMGEYGYIIRSDNLDRLLEACEFIHEEYK